MSNCGRVFKDTSKIPNPAIFEELRRDFKEEFVTPCFNIPSDTGSVCLNENLKLVAKQDIEKGREITSLPITKSDMVSKSRSCSQQNSSSVTSSTTHTTRNSVDSSKNNL